MQLVQHTLKAPSRKIHPITLMVTCKCSLVQSQCKESCIQVQISACGHGAQIYGYIISRPEGFKKYFQFLLVLTLRGICCDELIQSHEFAAVRTQWPNIMQCL